MPKVYPCGVTIADAMRYLKRNTHCGIYWNCKPYYNKKKGTVEIYMEGNEHVIYNLTTGKISRIDLDY